MRESGPRRRPQRTLVRVVRGRSVRYGGYRGTIEPGGGLQMAYGQNWIIGQFEGTTFHGQIDLYAGFEGLACSYMLSLARVGP